MAPNFYRVGEWTTVDLVCAGFYHVFIQLAMIFSVLAMIVSTLASSFGPTLTLTGKNSKMIIYGLPTSFAVCHKSDSLCFSLSRQR
jgi:hypothetical protein